MKNRKKTTNCAIYLAPTASVHRRWFKMANWKTTKKRKKKKKTIFSSPAKLLVSRCHWPLAQASDHYHHRTRQRSQLPPSQPPPSLPPSLPQAPPVPPPPFAIDATLSLAGNARRVVQARLGRPMTTAEGGALDAGLMVALSLLLPGGEAVRRGWLDSNVLAALSTQATAQLWACVLDASGNDRSDGGGDSRGVDTFVTALTDAASAIAGMQLASAFGL